MSDLVEKLDGLLCLDEGIHWFCPRSGAEDGSLFYDEDLPEDERNASESTEARRKKELERARQRQNDALTACKILAFDGDDAIQFQKKLKRSLHIQLSRCDVCVREYHRGRRNLREMLDAEYSPEEVQPFMNIFDEMNVTRIKNALDEMTNTLQKLPPAKRSISAAGDAGMYALFEALNCVPFLRNEEVLRDSFDTPFRLVQTNRKLRLGSFVPAMASFLFSDVPDRNEWATRSFRSAKRPPFDVEVKYAIEPFLHAALPRVEVSCLELAFLPRFWAATRVILTSLNGQQIVDCLSGSSLELIPMSREHIQIDADHFTDLIECYRILLEKNSRNFWDGMGGASPQILIEQICQSPRLEKMLKMTEEAEPLNLEQKFAWTSTFIQHINANNIVPPLQTLLGQLLHRFQQDQYSRYARRVTYVNGLSCLLDAIKLVKKSISGGPVVTKLIESVSQEHAKILLQELDGIEKKEEFAIDDEEQRVLDIVENILSLETQSLAHDRRIVVNKPDDSSQTEISSLQFWKMTLRHIKPGHPALIVAVLCGISGLLQLEKLAPAQAKRAPKQAEQWNSGLNRILDEVNSLLERLESFDSDSLEGLINDRNGARGIIMLMLNEDGRLQQASLSVLKSITGQDGRRECIMETLKARLPSILSSFASSFEAISLHRTFAPCPGVLKLGTDVFSSLCDSQDGILRSRQITDAADVRAVRDFWRTTWSALEMIFETTEKWSELGHDKTTLQDFCRETMDFAEFAFDQYSIFANTLRDSSPQDTSDLRKELLEQPNKAFLSIAKWLRLRDDYLIIKAVSLAVKILNRLHSAGIKVTAKSAAYLEGILASGKLRTKTNLSMNQKAELQRALENHVDEIKQEPSDSASSVSAPKKQGSLQGWVTAGRDSRSATPGSGTEVTDRAAIAQRKAPAALHDRKPIKQEPSRATQIANQKKMEERDSFLAKRKQLLAEQERQKQARAKAANLGAGSGVLGLGNLGKEHSVKGQNVMVSSDESEDEDDDDDIDDDLFGREPRAKKKMVRPDVDSYGAIGMKIEQKQGPTRIHRAQRSTKDMRARLAPDLTPLHRVILNWDFFHEGDFPPNSDPSLFSRVETSFRDPISYQNTFEPLLTLEAWQGMVRSREELSANNSTPYEIKVQNRSTVDSFMEISSLLDQNENKKLGLQEGDIILLSKARKPADDSKSPHCLARIYRIKRQKSTLEVLYHIPPTSPLAPQMSMQTVVYGLKIQSITPLEREYGALKALQYYDLCTQIVKAKPSQRINFSDKQIQNFQDVWNVNRAQSEAINAALENDGFSLIQGPPGSGKTKTIIAIVGGLLTRTLDNATSNTTRISMPKPNGNTNGIGDAPSKKLLVCAPSNAAVDELVMRLKDGVRTRNGHRREINVVRIGRSEAINAQVKDVTMEELVAKRLGSSEADPKKRQEQAELFNQHKMISTQLHESLEQRNKGDIAGNALTQLESSIAQLRKQRNELSVKIDNVKDQERNAGRQAELDRKRAQQAVLDGAHVICATLSGSGHDMFQGLNIEFETVIIDEAAQCVEMSSLIPLKYGCIKCIMVGDPKQLPPTVFSKEAAKFQYEQSLFVRMQNNHPDEVHLLDTQYRMHPHISLFPSRTFYDGLLKDGDGMAQLRTQPWHSSALLAPYRFFDVKGQQTTAPKGRSFINHAEIDVALALYHRLTVDCADYDFAGRIGIITPYKAQLNALKERFSRKYGAGIVGSVEFNTTDAFQGRESEVIIFSCVRASDSGGIGFLQDIRRMNVGLTRAKSSLWVLGNSASLVKGQYWKKLVEDAQARDCYTSGDLLSMLNQLSSKFPASKMSTTSMADAPPRREPAVKPDAHQNSKAASTERQSNGASTGVKEPLEPNSDRMEGVRYRFEDRVSKTAKTPQQESRSDTAAPAHRDAEDVEMADAEGDENGNFKSSAHSSRQSTVDHTKSSRPEHEDATASRPAHENAMASRHPEPVKTAVVPVAPLPAARKRAAPNPFMPRKKPKSGAR